MNVLVAGFFDRLHPGHIKFLKKASKFGDLYVNIGNDKNLKLQKNKKPLFNEEERKEMINSLKGVYYAKVSKEMGKLDWIPMIEKYKIDVFITNDDGNSELKKKTCLELNVPYMVLMKRDKEDWSTTKIQND